MPEEKEQRLLVDKDAMEFFRMVNSILKTPTTWTPPEISQRRLKDYLVIERYHEIIKEAYEKERAELLSFVDAKIPQEDGELIAVTETSSRRNPKWKEIVIERMGKQFADSVLDSTIPSMSLKLIVTFRAKLLEGGGRVFSPLER